MGIGRATFLFDDGAQGWSETYFRTANSTDAMTVAAKKLSSARVPLLGDHVSLAEVRLSMSEVFRDSQLVIPPKGNQMNKGAPAPDMDWTAFNVRIDSGSLYHGRLFLRGVPDETMVNDGVFPPNLTAEFAKDFANFKTHLISGGIQGIGGWEIYVANKENPKQGKLASVSVDNLGVITYITKAAHGLATGDTVNVIQVRDLKAVNGIKPSVVVVNPTTFRFTPTTVSLLPGTSNGSGYWYFYEKVLKPITDVFIMRATSRKPGRPFGQRPGRRSKARR